MKLNTLSLFFPCLNEASNLDPLINDALLVAHQCANDFEVIIVDDGSRDGTAAKMQEWTQRDSRVRWIQHPSNFGYGRALQSGIAAARYEWIFYSDGDRQFDLQQLPLLIEQAKDADIVSGYRVERADPVHRKLNAALFGWALKTVFRLNIPDVDCAFKLYRTSIFAGMRLRASGAMIDSEILLKARQKGFRIAVVPIAHRPRMQGQPTGAKLSVIFRAMREFVLLWLELHQIMDTRNPKEPKR